MKFCKAFTPKNGPGKNDDVNFANRIVTITTLGIRNSLQAIIVADVDDIF